MDTFPTKKELMNAIIDVLDKKHTTPTQTINILVAQKLNLSPELLAIEDANCCGSEYSYRMRWARTELKQKHLIDNPSRGQWIKL